MYIAKAKVITRQGILTKGKEYKPTPELDRLFDLGYLEKSKPAKKKTKKPTNS
jgi:hypothetical protein